MKDTLPTQQKLFSSKALYALLWPLIVEQFLTILVGMADIVMVSTLGEEAVSGVSLVDSLNVLLLQVFAALATGGAVVASQFLGSGDMPQAQKTARQLLYVTVLIALFVMLFCLAFHKYILSIIFGKIEDTVMSNAQRYFIITIFTLPFVALYNSAAALFRSQGNSRVSMLVSLLVNILNILGNAIFLYMLHFGVEGVAFPTLISRFIAAAILLTLLYNATEYRGHPSICIKGISKICFDARLVWKILCIGIPTGLENGMFQIGKVLLLSLVSTFGTVAIAANACANTIASFEVLPAAAIGLGMLTVVGQCIGAKDKNQAKYYIKRLMKMAYISMWILNIPLLIFLYKLLDFYNLSLETHKLAFIISFMHGSFGLLIWPCSFTLPNALRATNDATFTMAVSMSSMCLVRVGLSYVFKATALFGLMGLLGLPLSYGVIGVWAAMILDWVARSCFFICRTKKILNTK